MTELTEEEVVAFINACCEKEIALGAASLSDFERMVALVSWIDYELALGGFLGFFYNSAGDKAFATVEALTVIGADSAADAVQKAVYLFPDQSRLAEREYRQDHILSLCRSFRLLEPGFESQNPCVRELMIDYVRRNYTELTPVMS